MWTVKLRMNFMKQIKTHEEQPKMDKGMHRPSKEARYNDHMFITWGGGEANKGTSSVNLSTPSPTSLMPKYCRCCCICNVSRLWSSLSQILLPISSRPLALFFVVASFLYGFPSKNNKKNMNYVHRSTQRNRYINSRRYKRTNNFNRWIWTGKNPCRYINNLS